MYYKLEIDRLLAELEESKQRAAEELSKMPPGTIRLRKRYGRDYYLHHIPKGGNRKVEHNYTLSGDDATIRCLIRKRYLQESIKTLEHDIEVLMRAKKSYRPFDPASLQEGIKARFPELGPEFFDPKTNAIEWANDYEQTYFAYRENMVNVTIDNRIHRSKSEMYIGERLKHHGIPFRIEPPLRLTIHRQAGSMTITEAKLIHPDFEIMRPSDGKIFYWEHAGLVNDKDYIRRHRERVLDLEENGIVEWDNLIITYDTPAGGIPAKEIEAAIESRLL